MSFYNILSELCNNNGTTVTAFAKKLGLSTSMPTNWKKGMNPNIETLVKIADYFNVTPDYLLGYSSVPLTSQQFTLIKITNAFKKYTRLSGVKEIRLHDLRHSFVSMLIHLGANYNVIADLISDTVEQVIQTYGHLYVSDKAEIIKKIG